VQWNCAVAAQSALWDDLMKSMFLDGLGEVSKADLLNLAILL